MMREAEIGRLLQAAATAQRAGRNDEAADRYAAVLRIAPDQPVARNALGMHALAGGDHRAARDHFARATAADPGAGPLWLNLAKAQRLLGDDAGERASLDRALALDRTDFMALIRMAELNQRRGEDAQAMERWNGVLALAAAMPQRGPELEALLDRARGYVAQHGRRFAQTVESALAEARIAAEGAARRRFDACVDHALGRRTIYANQCEGLFYPFLPADEFFDRDRFGWIDAFEAATATIRAEAVALLAGDAAGFVPYVAQGPGTPRNKWSALDNSADWGAFYLWRFGERDEAACARCPATAAAIAALPLARIDGRAPTAFFSLLRPKTRIPPHTGVSNTRAIVHLPLIVPEGCGFRVGGETRQWEVGRAFAFDDTIEHEAWNDSDALRVVLIVDVWNPHLLPAERELLRRFYAAADATGLNPDRPAG